MSDPNLLSALSRRIGEQAIHAYQSLRTGARGKPKAGGAEYTHLAALCAVRVTDAGDASEVHVLALGTGTKVVVVVPPLFEGLSLWPLASRSVHSSQVIHSLTVHWWRSGDHCPPRHTSGRRAR